MARSVLIGSFVVLVAGAALAACSDGDTTTPPPGDTTTGSGNAGPGGSGGATSSSGPTTSSSSAGGAGGIGGSGGAGGAGGGVGGAGGNNTGGTGGIGVGGAGGAGGAPPMDQDGDGWTPADGDCCDNDANCSDPELVNPGAFEYLGNSLDDDCDPATPDLVPVPDCGGSALAIPTSSIELIHAMDLCQETTESPPLNLKKWGVISSALVRADGSAAPAPADVQTGVLAAFGPNVLPKRGATMAAISSGTARAVGDPGYVHPQNGPLVGQVGNYNANTQSGAPPEYLAANGGSLPSPPACPACVGPNCTQAFDSVNLKARIRVPTNALSFSYNFKFYSAEFPEFLCEQYNDFFVTLLTSAEPTIPADKNIAFDAAQNPVSVNNAFFEVCFPPIGAPAGTCASGTFELVGNGMGGWGNAIDDGGGTVWLVNESPIVPGETIDIEFVLWDAGDHNVDSLALLDRFRWSVTPSTVGVHR